jgi:hypothetical protein
MVDAKDSGMHDGDVVAAAGEEIGVLVDDLEAADGMGASEGKQEGDVEGLGSRRGHTVQVPRVNFEGIELPRG